jgi:putative redox protein
MKQVNAHIGKDRYQTTLTSRGHALISDEPATSNGTDLGPAPEELLLMSLASCTAITLRMYADRSQLPVDAIDVNITSDKIEDTFIFNRDITISGTLSEEQRGKLFRVADACPVHKILTHPIKINTTLV